MSNAALIDIDMLTPETATGPAKDLLTGAKAKMGFLPNMYGYMAQLPGVLGGYLAGYDAFRQTAGFTPPEQETVFLSISKVNGCDYCVAAHSMLADKKSNVPAADLAALRAGTPLPDAKLEALARFTRTMVEKRGAPAKAEVAAFLAAGYTPQHTLGIVLAIATKTFSNYVNHLAGTEMDAMFASYKID
ncbi:MAG: carboxymuconolactone decarboxylase family protein [Paracoccaceae bacterium]|nr:carboxymuconolactone decarboxylase family protein [Paracoccaceae bacterium]